MPFFEVRGGRTPHLVEAEDEYKALGKAIIEKGKDLVGFSRSIQGEHVGHVRFTLAQVFLCPNKGCQARLQWEVMGGMRLFQEKNGRKEYKVRCTAGHDNITDGEGCLFEGDEA